MINRIKILIKNMWKTALGETSTYALVKRGLKVGRNFSRQGGCFIDNSHPWLISIGDNVTLSRCVTILAHDASTKAITGYTKIGTVHIGNSVFVGANSTILCGVTIGDNVIIGANSIVTKDVPSNSVVAGNPARVICSMEEYREKIMKDFEQAEKFSFEYNYASRPSKEMILEQYEKTKEHFAYIE